MTTRPIAPGLFAGPADSPTLLGGRCPVCGTYTFPFRDGCPRCGATHLDEQPLARRGTLWSWTTQGFLPKAPFTGQFSGTDPFEPWLVGLVELPDQLRVEGLLIGCTQDDLEFDMPMRVVLMPFRSDTDGAQVMTFAFTPDPTEEAAHA